MQIVLVCLQAIPSVVPYTQMLDSLAPTYDSLPQPPSLMLVEAQSSVVEIVQKIKEASFRAGMALRVLFADQVQ
jgi:hypothetical protein